MSRPDLTKPNGAEEPPRQAEGAEAKLAEELRQCKELYRVSFELSPLGRAQIDPVTGRFQRVNPKLCEITGYSAAELLDMTFDQLTHPDEREAGLATFQRVVRGELPLYAADNRYVRKNGQIVWVDVNAALVRDAAGQPVSTIAAIQDVTDRKRAEQERQDLLKEYRMMFDSVPALIWYKDCDNRILRVNRPAAESMGKSVADLEGKSTYDLYPEEAAKYHRDDLEVINSGRPKLGIIEKVVTRSGDKLWVQTDKVPYRSEHGEIIGVIVFAMDVTERQHAQEEVRKLNAELEQRVIERTAQLEAARTALVQRANARRGEQKAHRGGTAQEPVFRQR